MSVEIPGGNLGESIAGGCFGGGEILARLLASHFSLPFAVGVLYAAPVCAVCLHADVGEKVRARRIRKQLEPKPHAIL